MNKSKIVPDVLCVGAAAWDLTFLIPHHPAPDEKMVAEKLIGCGGGPAANAAVTVSRLGLRAGFAGYLGRDFFGEQHFREFVWEGVIVELLIRGDHPTPLSVSLVKPDGKRALVNYRGAARFLSPQEIDLRKVKAKIILFDGHEPEISLSLASIAEEKGIPTVLDAGSLHRGTRELIDRVNYLICSEKFARQFTGHSDEITALRKLHQRVPVVIITIGERGLVWKSADGEGRLPAFKIKAVDTTGAGDVFHGAFCVGLAEGKPLPEILRFASAAAAISCTRPGGRPGIPPREELNDFMKKTDLPELDFES